METGVSQKKHSSNHFFDLFPTPNFLEMSAPGIALEDSVLRFVEFSRTKEGLILKDYDSLEIPHGVIEDGEILNKPKIIELLSEFRNKHNLRNIRCVIPEEKGYLFRTRIPKVSSLELDTAIEFVIEENVPISVSESVFDYTVIENSKDLEDENHIDVSVSVVPEQTVQSYIDIFHSAGMTPLHFEMESQAVLKASISRDDKESYLLIHFFDKKACVAVADDNVINFSSAVLFPKEKLADAKNKDISSEVFSEIEIEAKKILSYWDSQFEKIGKKSKKIETLILSGRGAGSREVIKKLDSLGLNIKTANVWINAFSFDSFVPPISKEESLEYATAIGLALPHHFHF